MTDQQSDEEVFPRPIYDEGGNYTIRKGAKYRVDDRRIRELAEIDYARRDIEAAHEMVAACAEDEIELLHERALWVAAVVMYGKPFKANYARTEFNARAFITQKLAGRALELHEVLMRYRDWMFAHDDGLGESKALEIYLPHVPPRSSLEVGLWRAGGRVISLGQDIARELEPHFAMVRGLFFEHEKKRRNEIAEELIRTRFAGMNVLGVSVQESLDVNIETVLAMASAPRSER
ncbi:hypothetical protein [Arenimonas malthae]|nr:hypothetical protein [Arenimonas malthae]